MNRPQVRLVYLSDEYITRRIGQDSGALTGWTVLRFGLNYETARMYQWTVYVFSMAVRQLSNQQNGT